MATFKVTLALITQDNDYQREQASVAEAAAKRLGIELRVMYANGDAIAQTHQLLAAIHAPVGERPDALVVEPVGTGMPPVAKAAVQSGIGWVVLNRDADYLLPLRADATVPVGSVDCDNVEVGRIQGRQFAALLPSGGTVLYVEGPATDAAKQRRAGAEQTLPKSIELRAIRGKWTEKSAQEAVASRLQVQTSQAPNVGVIGCQNDAMAMGARKAVEAMITEAHRRAWLELPFTGVDGVPTSGQQWVKQGLLTATVVTPALTGVALELLAKALPGRTQIPERTLLKPVSYPPVDQLRPKTPPATPR